VDKHDWASNALDIVMRSGDTAEFVLIPGESGKKYNGTWRLEYKGDLKSRISKPVIAEKHRNISRNK